MKMFRIHSILEKKEEKKDKDLLVAASVIAAMAYQAAISPPGGVASVDASLDAVPPASSYQLRPSDSLLASFYSKLSDIFWIFNTISLMASLSVIFLYVSGFSLKRHIQIWVIRIAMWITLSSMTVAYVCAVIATTPTTDLDKVTNTLTALIIAMIAWAGLLIFSLVILGVRFFCYLFTDKNESQLPSKQENTSHEVEMAAHIE
ncbi:hypothetical protein AgCh_029187 [Apium graveolens]